MFGGGGHGSCSRTRTQRAPGRTRKRGSPRKCNKSPNRGFLCVLRRAPSSKICCKPHSQVGEQRKRHDFGAPSGTREGPAKSQSQLGKRVRVKGGQVVDGAVRGLGREETHRAQRRRKCVCHFANDSERSQEVTSWQPDGTARPSTARPCSTALRVNISYSFTANRP